MLLKVIQFCLICLLVLQNGASAHYVEKQLIGPLEPPMVISIETEIFLGALWEFHVDFQQAKDLGPPEGDIALRISVRFIQGEDRIVFNSQINGEWGQEEYHDGLPPTNGPFGYTLRITPRDDDFLINLNGKEYNFKNRMSKEDLGKIKIIVIDGDVTINSIDFFKLIKEPIICSIRTRYEPY